MIDNDDYSRIRTATRSNCSFLCLFIRQVARFVKQGNSSHRSCRPNASNIQILRLVVLFRAHFIDIPSDGQTHPARDRLRWLGIEHHTLEKSFRNVERLRHLLSRFHFLSRHDSKGRNLVLRALSGFIDQLEVHLLVHDLQLPLHVQGHGVSSSPTGTMFASAPSKLLRSTSRTTHPSRLSPEVVLHVEHSQWRLCCGVTCVIMFSCPCGQNGRSISTGRFPVDASTVRLFSVVSGSRATMVRGRCHRCPLVLRGFQNFNRASMW